MIGVRKFPRRPLPRTEADTSGLVKGAEFIAECAGSDHDALLFEPLA